MQRLVKHVLADVAVGAIVRVNGSWGVVTTGKGTPSYERVIDFWDVGRTFVKKWTIVELLV